MSSKDPALHLELRLGNTIAAYDGPASQAGAWLAYWLSLPNTRALPSPVTIDRLFVWPWDLPPESRTDTTDIT